jgi:anaerobic magnesium-protoporphyrin IX monomethyl ester cyclase
MPSKPNRKLMLVYVNMLMGQLTRRQMPLGLQMVAAAARKTGWEPIGRYWGSELTVAAFEEDLRETGPDLVGFYTDLFNVYTLSRLLARIPAAARPTTILGGPEATFNYRRVMKRCQTDLLVRGDGEPAIIELLQHDFRDPGFLRQVQGLSYRNNGEVHHNPDRPYGSQTDYPFPDWTLLPNQTATLHLLTARGCSHHCAFCSEAQLPYRPREIEQVKAELHAALQIGKPRWIIILDDTFTTNTQRAAEISRYLKEIYGGPWSCEVAPRDICRHPELARQMVESGLARVQIGLDSGNNETLTIYQKDTTRSEIEEAIEILLAAGVKAVYGNFIVGAPGETAEMVRANMDFACDLIRGYPGRVELSASVLTYNAGAPFFENPESYGLLFSQESILGSLDFRCPACSTQTLKSEEIRELHDEFQQRLSQAVDGALKELTPEQLRDQLHFNEVGFSTGWNKKLLSTPHIAKHYQYVRYEGSYLDILDIAPDQLENAIPQRTKMEVQLAADGNVVVSGLSGEIKHLNANASFLDEIACGQLTIREIAEVFYNRLPSSRPPFATVLRDTIDFYTMIAQEMYIAFVIP